MRQGSAARRLALALAVLAVLSPLATGLVASHAGPPGSGASDAKSSGPGPSPSFASLSPALSQTPLTSGRSPAASPSALGTLPPAAAGPTFPATVFPPNPEGSHVAGPGYVSTPYGSAPAPMGVSDLGVGPNGSYAYATTRFEGNVTVNSFQAFTPTNITDVGYSAPDWALLQLNTVVANVSSYSGSDGTYWIQNGVHLNGTTLQFEDNVWNFTSLKAPLLPSTLEGTLGRISELRVYAGILPAVAVTLPFTLDLVSSVSSATDGHTVVSFGYTLMDGASPTTKVYDTVTFNGSERAGPPQFRVDGSAPNAAGYLDDAELVLGGNGGGSNADLLSLNATARLLRWDPAVSAYRSVPSAYDFGADSSETALGVAVSYTGTTVHLSQGPSFLEGLWNTTSNGIAPHAQAGSIHVHLELTPGYAFVFATNLSLADGPLTLADYSYAPTSRNGNLTTDLPPPLVGQPYVFRAWADGFTSQSLNVSASTTQSLVLVASHASLDTPVYLLGSGQGAEFGKAKVTGAGYSPSAGMLWLNATRDDLAAPFVRVNDFNASTFQLVVTAGLNLSLTANGFVQSPATFNYTGPLGRVLDLPYWTQGYFFYHGRGHFSVQNTTISGIPALAHLRPPQFPLATIQFLGTNDAFVGNVTASDDAIGVRLFDATTVHLNHIVATTGAIALSSSGSSGLFLSHAGASGKDPYAHYSVLAELNRTSAFTGTALSASASALGILSEYGTGLSVTGFTVTTGAVGFSANWTNSSEVTGLSVGVGPLTSAGSWSNGSHVLFNDLTSRATGLVVTYDPSLTVENSLATGPNASLVVNTTGSNGATFTGVRANDTATALILTHCGAASVQGLSATNDSTGVVVQEVTSFSGHVISSTGESVGAYVNDTVGASLSQVTVSDLSVGVFAANSSALTVSGVTATNATLGGTWNFTNASLHFFPVAGVGLSNVTGANVTNVFARSYPYAVWSANSTSVTVRDVTDFYGVEAVAFSQTSYSHVVQVFAYGDRTGVALVNCTHSSLKGSTLELSSGVGVYVTNGSHVSVSNDSFVGNNGSSASGSFNALHDQALAINTTAPAFRSNFWADRSKGAYVINANASIRDPSPRASPPSVYLEFTERGLPGGDLWTLTLSGTAYTTGVSLLLIPGWELTVGSLPFTVGLIAGYPPHPPSGTAPWTGVNATIAIVFGNPGSPSSAPPLWVYAAAGAGVALAAIAVVLVLRRRHRAPPPPPPPRQGPRGRAQGPGRPVSRPAARRPSNEWSPDDPR